MRDIFKNEIPVTAGEYWIRQKNGDTVRTLWIYANESWQSQLLNFWDIGPRVLTPEETDRATWLMANLRDIQIGDTTSGRVAFHLADDVPIIGHGDTIEAAIDDYREKIEPTRKPEPQTEVDEFQQHIENASATVATWPEWKQNVLRNSDKANCDVPRMPVDHSAETGK